MEEDNIYEYEGKFYSESALREVYPDTFDDYVSEGILVKKESEEVIKDEIQQDTQEESLYEYEGVSYPESSLREAYPDTFDDYVEQGVLTKVDSLGKQIAVEDSATATDMDLVSEDGLSESQEEDTWLERTFGKNEFTDFFGDIYRAGKQGFLQAESVDPSLDIMTAGEDASVQDLYNYVQTQKRIQKGSAESDEMKDFNRVFEESGGGAMGFLMGVLESPTVLPSLFVSSMATQIGSLASEEVAASAAAGAGTGAVAGSAIPLIGTATGALGGGFAGLATAMEAGLTFSELLQEEIDGEITIDKVQKILQDPEKLSELRRKAIGRGAAIGAVEALSAGLAGKATKAVAGAVKKGKSVAGRTARKAATTLAGGAVEVVGGSTGEVAGRLAAGQEMDVKEIGFEGIAGLGSAPLTVLPTAVKNINIVSGRVDATKKAKEGGYENVSSVFDPNTDIDETTMELAANKNTSNIVDEQVEIEVANGRMTQEESEAIKENFRATQGAVNTANKIDRLSKENKPEAVKLLIEEEKLKNKIEDVDNAALTKTESERLKEVQARLEEISNPKEEEVSETEIEEDTGVPPTPEEPASVETAPAEETIPQEELEGVRESQKSRREQGSLLNNAKKEEKVYLNGKEGNIKIDPTNENTIIFESGDEIIELGNKDEVGSEPIAGFGLTTMPPEGLDVQAETMDADVVSIDGKEYNVIGRRKDKKGKAVVKVKEVGTGLVRRIKGARAERVLKDLQLRKKKKEAPLPLTTEGKEVATPTKKERRAKRVAEKKKAREESDKKSLEELSQIEEESQRSVQEFEEMALEEAAQESKNKDLVQVGENIFQVTKNDDGSFSVSQMNESGRLIGTREEGKRRKAIGVFKSKKSNQEKRALAKAEKLIDEFKKEESQRIDDAINERLSARQQKAEGSKPAFNERISAPESIVTKSLQVLRNSYAAGMTLMQSIDDALSFIEEQGFSANEFYFKEFIVEVLGSPKPKETTKSAPTETTKTTGREKVISKYGKARIRRQVAKARKALSKIAKGVTIEVYETEQEFMQSTNGDNSPGIYEPSTKTIKINLERANPRTVAHEVFHALLLKDGITDERAQKITSNMLAAVRKVASPELLEQLDAFADQYKDKEWLKSEESIAELFGILAENYESSPQSVKDLINDWLRKLAKILNVPVEGILDSDKQVLEFLDVVSGKVARGEVIEQADIDVLQNQEQVSEGEVGTIKIPQTRQQKVFRAGDLADKAETIYKFEGPRSTGHFGTGFYFFGKKQDAQEYAKRTGTDTTSRIVSEVDLDDYNLAPASLALHKSLKDINDEYSSYSFLKRDLSSKVMPYEIERVATILGINLTSDLSSRYAEDITKKLRSSDNKESASTLVMKALGFDGVDATGTELDNSTYGTVVYDIKPQTRQQQAQDDFTIQDVIEDAEKENLTRKETIEVLQELGFTKDEIRSAMKPVKDKARSVASETTGLSPREAFKQGFAEFFDAIKRGKKEARQKAAENLKEKLNKVRESFKKKLQKEKDNKTARAAVVKEIRAIIKDSGLSRTSKRTINKIMTNVKNANVNNMQRMVDEVMDAINRDIDREARYSRLKTLKVAKNKLSRLGALKELQKPLMEVLNINPDYLSKTALKFYDRVIVNLANVEKKFDSRESREDLKNDAEEVIKSFTNDNIKAEELAEKTINPNLDLTKTKGENLKQMLKDGLISDSDFELMTRFNDLIGSTTKEELTLEELEQKAKERRDNAIEDFEAAMDEIPSSLPNLSKDDAEAVRFANGLKMKDLESLSTAEIKKLTRGLEMLQAGFVTRNLVQSKIIVEANRNITENLINETEERGKVDKAISSAKVFVKNLFRKRGDMITSIENRIKSTPLANIDQILNASAKKFKSTRIFETIFRPAAVAFNKTETFLKDTKKKLQKAESFLDLNTNRRWSQKAKVMLYQIQREYESNPKNKEVNTAINYANATINDKESNLSGREKKYLQKLIDKFSVDGQIDSKKLLESFTDKEKKYLAAVDDVYSSVEEMVAADAKMQGKLFIRRKNYVHLPMVTKTENSMSDNLNEIANTFTNPALKNKALTQRTGNVHAISFDPTFNANGIANKAAISYYMYPAVKKAKITLAGIKQKAETDFQKEVSDALENVFDNIVKSQYSHLSRDRAFIEKALAFLGRTGYLAQLAGPVKAAVELTTNITHAALTNPNNLISGFNTLKEVPRGVMDKAFGYLPSAQGRRITGDGVKDSKETEGRLISDSNNLFQEEQMTSEIRAKVNTLFKFAKKPLEKIIKFNEDLIAKPDTIVARPVFVGAFNASFENIANEKPNWEKIANDQAYRDKFREAINQATTDGDAAVVDNAASNNPFEGIPRNIVDRDATATKQALQMIDRYMSRFRTFEYFSSLKAIQGLMGKGKLTPTQGAMLLTATVVRLSLYKMGIDMVFSMIFSMMGIDEEEDEIELDKDLTKGVLGAVATLALGRSFGNISQMPINFGTEWLNKEYGEDITRSGEYNQYDDGIVFSKIPMEVKPQDNMVEKIVTSSLGSYTPMVKTLTRAGKLATRASTLKTEEARDRNFGELTTRIPFEIAGNMGVIPGYKSLRKIYNQYLFGAVNKNKSKGSGRTKKSTREAKKSTR